MSIPSFLSFPLSFLYGAVIGSFLNVVILRWPEDRKLSGRSECPNCKHTLAAVDLVPIVSFTLLGGKCRYCGKKISPRYAIIETICGFLFVAAWMYFGAHGDYFGFIKACVLLAAGLVVFVIDLEHYIILDRVVLIASLLFCAINIGTDIFHHTPFYTIDSQTIRGALGAAVGSLPFYLLWLASRGKWMGFGDVKLMIVLGLALGWPVIIVTMFAAFFLGALASIPLMVFGGKKLTSKVPFGTFLTVSASLCLFFGPAVLQWYLALIGI